MEIKDKPYTVQTLDPEQYKNVALRVYAICQKEFSEDEWRFLPSILVSCGISWNMACGVDAKTIRETIDAMVGAFQKSKEDGFN